MQPPKISLHKIYSTDGIELDSILFEPQETTKKIIIHVHGKEGHFIQNHFINHMGIAYPEVGYAFLTFNNRGHDYIADLLKKESSGYIWQQGGSVFDTIEEFPLDIQGVIDFVEKQGYEEIVLQGHSFGPHKISYYLSQNQNNRISKLIFLTTADIEYLLDTTVLDWQKWSIKAKILIDEGKEKELMPVKLWSDCSVSAKTFWSYTKPDNNVFVFNVTHPEKEFKHFNQLTLPILAINPENDFSTGGDPEKMVKFLHEKTNSKNLETHIINDAVHNFLGKEEELVKIITSWLTK